MITLYADGGCTGGNPGTGIYYSVAILHEDREVEFLVERKKRNRYKTNNQAEFMALITALLWIETQPGNETVRVLMDSQLIVKTVNGVMRCKSGSIVDLWIQARELFHEVQKDRLVHLRWTPRQHVVKVLGH